MSIGGIKNVVNSDFYDSFSIGGRWSGTLTTALLNQEKLKAFSHEVEKLYGWPVENTFSRINETAIVQKQKKALELFLNYFPKFLGEPPFFRDEYMDLGYEDDALLIENERQYYRLLNNYEGDWFFYGDYGQVELFKFI